eukprot:COSAG01_NODE_6131_length_3834_cov_6.695047_2_plen_91_part_00
MARTCTPRGEGGFTPKYLKKYYLCGRDVDRQWPQTGVQILRLYTKLACLDEVKGLAPVAQGSTRGGLAAVAQGSTRGGLAAVTDSSRLVG